MRKTLLGIGRLDKNVLQVTFRGLSLGYINKLRYLKLKNKKQLKLKTATRECPRVSFLELLFRQA